MSRKKPAGHCDQRAFLWDKTLFGECPIFLPTGEIGLVIRWIESENEIGIQIPGDDEIRWVPASRVSAYAEILRVSAD